MKDLKKDREESYWGAFVGKLNYTHLEEFQLLTGRKPLYSEVYYYDRTSYFYEALDDYLYWLDKAARVWRASWAHFRYFPLSVPEGLLMQTLQKELLGA